MWLELKRDRKKKSTRSWEKMTAIILESPCPLRCTQPWIASRSPRGALGVTLWRGRFVLHSESEWKPLRGGSVAFQTAETASVAPEG